MEALSGCLPHIPTDLRFSTDGTILWQTNDIGLLSNRWLVYSKTHIKSHKCIKFIVNLTLKIELLIWIDLFKPVYFVLHNSADSHKKWLLIQLWPFYWLQSWLCSKQNLKRSQWKDEKLPTLSPFFAEVGCRVNDGAQFWTQWSVQ